MGMSFKILQSANPGLPQEIELQDYTAITGQAVRSQNGPASATINKGFAYQAVMADYMTFAGVIPRVITVYTYRDGVQIPRETFQLESHNGSDVDETADVTYSGHYCARMLGETVLPYIRSGETTWVPETAPNVTLDDVLTAALARIQAHGGLLNVTLHVYGLLPAVEVDVQVGKQTFLDLLVQYNENKVLDFVVEMDDDGIRVNLFEYGKAGSNRTGNPLYGPGPTVGPPVVEFRRGLVSSDPTRTVTTEGYGTTLIVQGAGGALAEATDADALAAVGRRIEVSVQRDDIYTQESATDFAARALVTITRKRPKVNHQNLVCLLSDPNDPTPVPYVDFGISDQVLSATQEGKLPEVLEVHSIDRTVLLNGDVISYDVEVGDPEIDIKPRIFAQPTATTVPAVDPTTGLPSNLQNILNNIYNNTPTLPPFNADLPYTDANGNPTTLGQALANAEITPGPNGTHYVTDGGVARWAPIPASELRNVSTATYPNFFTYWENVTVSDTDDWVSETFDLSSYFLLYVGGDAATQGGGNAQFIPEWSNTGAEGSFMPMSYTFYTTGGVYSHAFGPFVRVRGTTSQGNGTATYPRVGLVAKR